MPPVPLKPGRAGVGARRVSVGGMARHPILSTLLALVAVACSIEQPTSAPTGPTPSTARSAEPTSAFPSFDEAEALSVSEPMRFRAEDGTRLEGRLFGSGEIGVVLGHMRPGSQSQWLEFAALLADQGYRVLTYNRRGTCPGEELGCSDGIATGDDWADLASAVDLLRETGARRVVVGGASLGAMEALYALSRGLEADGLIWVSGFDLYGLVPVTRQVRDVDVPKLFMAGERDADAAELLTALERAAPPPTRVVVLDTGEHGTDMLAYADPAVADEFRRAILDFLGSIPRG